MGMMGGNGRSTYVTASRCTEYRHPSILSILSFMNHRRILIGLKFPEALTFQACTSHPTTNHTRLTLFARRVHDNTFACAVSVRCQIRDWRSMHNIAQ